MVKIILNVVGDERVETSAKKFGEGLGVDYATAQGFIKLLVEKGAATLSSKQKNVTGKGKPTNIYSLPAQLQVTLYEEQPVKEVA